MNNLIWTWVLNQSINRRGYRAEPGTRHVLIIAAAIFAGAIGLALITWWLFRAS